MKGAHVLYSIGSNGDSTSEQQMMRRASCKIYTFDPFTGNATKEAVRGTAGIIFHDWGAGEHFQALAPAASLRYRCGHSDAAIKRSRTWPAVIQCQSDSSIMAALTEILPQ